REGDVWTLTGGASVIRLKDGKGVVYLDALLRRAGDEVHVADLVGLDDTGDAGAVLDPKARQQYKTRLDELRSELAEAERFGDVGRTTRLREELDAIGEE